MSDHTCNEVSNGSQYVQKPRSYSKYGSASRNAWPQRTSASDVQSSCGNASNTPNNTDMPITASSRYRLGTSSPISMLATRRGSTSETTEWRTAYRFRKKKTVATSPER